MFSVVTIKQVQNNIGQWCKTLRKREGITQQELADQLVLSRLTISKLERGENFTIDTFLKVLQHFDQLSTLNDFVTDQSDLPESLY